MWLYQKGRNNECAFINETKISLGDKFIIGYLDNYNNFKMVKFTNDEKSAVRLVNYLNGGDGKLDMIMEDLIENRCF